MGVHETVAAPSAPVSIAWDMYVKKKSFPLPGSFGPYMGVEAYDDLGNPPLLAGSAGVDASTGEVLYQAAGSGYIVSTGQTLPFDSWHHFNMVLNYASHSYSVYVDGTPLVSNIGFVDAGVKDFTDAPFAALAAGADSASQQASGQAYFDNYTIGINAPTGYQSVYNAGGFEYPLFVPEILEAVGHRSVPRIPGSRKATPARALLKTPSLPVDRRPSQLPAKVLMSDGRCARPSPAPPRRWLLNGISMSSKRSSRCPAALGPTWRLKHTMTLAIPRVWRVRPVSMRPRERYSTKPPEPDTSFPRARR